LLHFAVALSGAGHFVVQSPQKLGSVLVSTHLPPQVVGCSTGQLETHAGTPASPLAEQMGSVGGQTLVQEPQR
jgi:hypothetical protein